MTPPGNSLLAALLKYILPPKGATSIAMCAGAKEGWRRAVHPPLQLNQVVASEVEITCLPKVPFAADILWRSVNEAPKEESHPGDFPHPTCLTPVTCKFRPNLSTSFVRSWGAHITPAPYPFHPAIRRMRITATSVDLDAQPLLITSTDPGWGTTPTSPRSN